VTYGALAPGLACGSFIATTDAWNGPFSRAEFVHDPPVSTPFAVQVTWQRLGPDAGESLSIVLPQGYLLLRRGQFGFYAYSESGFRWLDLPGFSPHRESTVRVEQRPQDITLWVDGQRAGVIPFVAGRTVGTVGIGFKGAPGYRSRMRFRDFSVTPLDPGPRQASATSSARPK
jgi:hypothetical protein